MKKIIFNGSKLSAKIERYNNGSCAVILYEKHEEYLTLSTNLNNSLQDHNCIFVKNNDVHEDIAKIMVRMGLLEEANHSGSSGYNTYSLYKITPLLFKQAQEDV